MNFIHRLRATNKRRRERGEAGARPARATKARAPVHKGAKPQRKRARK